MKHKVVIFAPHPDDESITGLLPLRLRQECGIEIWVVPVTTGRNIERRLARARELRSACRILDFRICFPMPPVAGVASLKEVSAVLKKIRPELVFLPHARDGHPTHQAVHWLGVMAMDAARQKKFQVVETEYWHPLVAPNLLVVAHRKHLQTLRRALSCHVGEMVRNDYAARLPAWMSDNVRRGAELIKGRGATAPKIAYATLYRARIRTKGEWQAAFHGGRIINSTEDLQALVDFKRAPAIRRKQDRPA